MKKNSTVERTNPRKSKHVQHIGGIPVEFPYQPYGSQLAFMGRVISTLDRAQRDGHCHALLESPTGTGKSLSLLCSALAWQKNHRSKLLFPNASLSKAAPEAMTNPIAFGGGFVPETQPSVSGTLEPPGSSAPINKNTKKKSTPTIFYASRTHSQITQVIQEYRKTAYRVPMAVLASRKHYCTNTHVRGKDNIDEQCKLLLKNREVSCPEFKNMHKVKAHPSLQKGGCHEAHDIEDIVKVGQVVKGCSYYAARSMADDAQLVFCPYSYVINPVIRRAMEVDIKGAIIILDEAHNMEDMARDAGSMEIEENILLQLQAELCQLSLVDAMIYQPLYEMTQDIMSWIERKKETLEKREFQHYFHCWTGDKALKELQEANISQQCFPILQECATKAIKVASDAELDIAHLSGMSATTLEGLFSSLSYFFSGDGIHIFDYQLALQRYVKRDAENASGGWTHSMSLWCLNPAVVFKDIANLSLSVILTSGTLSPMNSFSSELGVQFGTCLEAPHVIDVESQLWTAVISTGPGNYPLNASYKTADTYNFQDALGKSLEEICKSVPGGCLVFFPSYKLMEKLCTRWKETGQWSQLDARKTLFVEPRGGNLDDLEPVLKGYHDSIHQVNKPAFGRKRRGKKLGLTNHNAVECFENPKKDGAAFLAVCRGKVSEGIDFSDDNARVVIIVGIPFPNIHDIQVAQKKKYNDTYRSSKNLLSGNEWYCHQAFRALNQAAGRCIRHRLDYGAIIFLDERFREDRNIKYVSKWLRNSIHTYENFENSMEGLKSFFRDVKERVGNKTVNDIENSNSNVEDISCMDQSKEDMRKKIQKVNKSNQWGPDIVANSVPELGKSSPLGQSPRFSAKRDVSFTPKISQCNFEAPALASINEKNTGSCREYIDLECGDEDSRCCRAQYMTLSPNDPDISIVKETPGMDGSVTMGSPEFFTKDEHSSTIYQASIPSRSLPDSSAAFKVTHSLVVTPDRDVTANVNSYEPETESFHNPSVNSHTQKRRKSMGSPLADLVQAELFDAPSAKPPGRFDTCSESTRDTKSGIEFGFETNNNSGNNKLQIFCSVCRNPLGLQENNLYVMCSLTSSSKAHLANLLKGTTEPLAKNTLTSIRILISDVSSINQQLCKKSLDAAPAQGIWCREDGCVFNTIFCPFCVRPDYFLGVQVMATDAANVHLLNKIIFYFDRLEIKSEASNKKELSSISGSTITKSEVSPTIETFACSPRKQNLGGWRTTKSKMRLPRKGLFSTSEG